MIPAQLPFPQSLSSLPSALPLPAEGSTQSQSSSENSQSSSKRARNFSKREIDELGSRIKAEAAANRKRYERLQTINPYFSIKLFAPSLAAGDECRWDTAGKLMREIDLLLEEGNLLEKEIKKSELRRMHADHLDPTQRSEVKNHFTFLRKVWLDGNRPQMLAGADLLEELNKKVVIIKNSVMSVSDHEKKCYSFSQAKETYQIPAAKVAEVVRGSEEYLRLKELYERAQMALEEQRGKLQRVCSIYDNKIEQKNRLIALIQKQLQDQRKSNKDLKEKLLGKQAKELQLFQRISDIESELKSRSKPTPKLVPAPQPQVLKAYREQNYINQIKFRRMEFEPHVRKPSFESKQPQVTCSEKTIEAREPEERAATEHQIREDAACVEQQNGQEGEKRGQLMDNKSVDGKRGRFTRMRSPANGKLLKTRGEDAGEVCSPRVRAFREGEESAQSIAT